MNNNRVDQLPPAEGALPTDLLAVSRQGRWRKLPLGALAAGTVYAGPAAALAPPPAGQARLFYDTGTGKVSVMDSSGTVTLV